MIRNAVIVLALLFTVALTACSGKEGGTPDSKTTPAKVTTAETPSSAVTQFLNAERARRYSEVRELLSQRSLQNFTDAAGKAGTNVDQALKRQIDNDAANFEANNVTSFETRNEEINGQSATVEVRGTNAPEYARVSLTKEGERWKINIDETAPAK